MITIKELWVAKDKYGQLTLFTEEPWGAGGEWSSNSGPGMEIEDNLINSTVSLDRPQRVYLSVKP